MKVTLEFDLNKEAVEFKRAMRGKHYLNLIDAFDSFINAVSVVKPTPRDANGTQHTTFVSPHHKEIFEGWEKLKLKHLGTGIMARDGVPLDLQSEAP